MTTEYNGNYNSPTNQDIKSDFVRRGVVCNLNLVIQHLQEHGAGDWEEELTELSDSIDWEETKDSAGLEQVEDEDGDLVWTLDGREDTFEGELSEAVDYFEVDIRYTEVCEYWSVSDYFAEKLKEKGESVVDILGHYVWGRTATGQSIILDKVISDIASDMEILEGQANDWSRSL